MTSPQTIAMDLVANLPGCRAERFALEANTVLSGRVMGWGPSLHRTGLAWAATPAHMDAEAIATAFAPYMEVQRRRIALAAALGLDTTEQPDPGLLSHMVTDRLLLAWDRDLRAVAPRRLARLNQLSRAGREEWIGAGDLLVADAGSLEGDDEDDPRPRLLYASATHWGEYNGRTVTVFRTMPESLIPAAAGRTLGEVVDLGTSEPQLDGLRSRTITAARVIDRGVAFDVAPDWVSLKHTN